MTIKQRDISNETALSQGAVDFLRDERISKSLYK